MVGYYLGEYVNIRGWELGFKEFRGLGVIGSTAGFRV